MITPIDPQALDVLPDRINRRQKLSLLHGESADAEIDGRALLKQQERFQHGHRILAPGDRDRHAIALPDHTEPMNRLAYLAKQRLFEIHSTRLPDARLSYRLYNRS